MANRKLGPSSGKCSKCGGRISVNPPRPCPTCSGEKLEVRKLKKERTFTESEVRAMMDDVKMIAADHSRKCYTNRIEQMTPPAPVAFHIDNYLWKSHGISSNPA